MTIHAEHAHLHARDSLSHIHISAEVLDSLTSDKKTTKAKSKSSLSHVVIPDSKKKSKASLSHISNDDVVSNKEKFIHNLVKDTKASASAAADVVTVDTVVYVTATRTKGASSSIAATTSASSTNDAAASYESAKSAAQRKHTWSKTKTDASTTSSIVTSSSVAYSSAAAASTTATAVVGTALTTSRSSTSSSGVATISSVSSASNAKTSSGMSSGSKAGLGFGVIIALALAAGLVFFCWRRRKNQNREDKEGSVNEKHGSFFGSNQKAPSSYRGSVASISTSRSASTASRLSLRPVTQFLPNIMTSEKSINPFDDDVVAGEKQANPFDETDGRKSPSDNSTLVGSEPSTPAKVGTAAAVAVAGSRGPNNVHRVQLDFKPSMDDELELKSGQLVRMLHEYDDGWALCIRMDRSQQGVCPRTCLSKLAVKPRPQGPPQNGRPAPSPPQAGNMVPRPLTPNGQNRERSQTMDKAPAPSQGSPRNRSQSVSDGASVPSRKPVPGQAL